jgi:DNA-directed RNA polymerase specialized sigma24 family protein
MPVAAAHTRQEQKYHAPRRRAGIERMLNRAAYLQPADRALLRQALDQGVPARELAILLGCDVRTVQNRVRRLVRRLNHPETVAVLKHLDDWPHDTAAVAIAVWLQGLSQRDTSSATGLTYHQVRQQVQLIRGYLQAR